MAAKEKNLKDHEYSMARSEIKTLKNAAKKLEKKMGKRKEGDLEAWVQSKITKAADYIDTASDYVTNESNTNLTIDPKKHREQQRASKIRTLAQQGATAGERKAAENKTKGPKLFGENISLVQKILGEEKCGAGMYWCNTDKVCKPLPSGFDVPGQTKKPTEVGIGKKVASEGKTCNHTKKGSSCPVHGTKDCSIKELGYRGSKHDALIFKGERWEMSGISGCTVPVYKKDFEEKFSICFLTAMRVMKTGECSFRGNGKHHGDDVYYFEFDDKESLHCEFSCMK